MLLRISQELMAALVIQSVSQKRAYLEVNTAPTLFQQLKDYDVTIWYQGSRLSACLKWTSGEHVI
jgi:hypothetical protein